MIEYYQRSLTASKLSFRQTPSVRYDLIYSQVQAIPEGCVATYGQIGHLAGLGHAARQVGRALAVLSRNTPIDGKPIPWHRVVNAKGEISPRANADGILLQRILLEEEGIDFTPTGLISLRRFQWKHDTINS